MIDRKTYTKIFLKQLNKSTDAANVKLHMNRWWQSKRTKENGGLRLSRAGYELMRDTLDIREYDIPFTSSIDLSPQTIIFLDQFMDCPYYLTPHHISVFSEKKHFELYMFSDDISRYGLMKAIKNRQKNYDPD